MNSLADNIIDEFLTESTPDELARIAFRILDGHYGAQSDAFVDTFDKAYHELDAASAIWFDQDREAPDRFERARIAGHNTTVSLMPGCST
jgi:hypothetical protein